jgi:hypothetical protein
MSEVEYAVVILVVGARLLLPLAIPYFPLPAIVACLVLDAADQTIFQQFHGINLDSYQSYDKALDIYYLSIAYLSTMRNWTNKSAFRVARFLFYYRLTGDVLFEITEARALLFIFPNTFEYFFIFYEAVRMRWDTSRMGRRTVILAAALIWVFIKLPQEWWIHLAKLDVTEAIGNAPWVLLPIVAVLALLVFVGWWVVTRKAPAADHGIRFKADPLPAECLGAERYRTIRATEKLFDGALFEKVMLTGLVSVVFAQMLAVGDFRLAFVATFVILNAFVSQLLARRGRIWRSIPMELAGMGAVNLGIILGLEIGERVLGILTTNTPLGKTLFFVFLLTVLTVLFDRYHTVLRARGVLDLKATT